MSDRVSLVFIASDTIWRPANGSLPAARVFSSLESLQAAQLHLVLVAANAADADAVRKMCASQGIEFEKIIVESVDAAALTTAHGASIASTECRLIGGSTALRDSAQQLGIVCLQFDASLDRPLWPDLVHELTARHAVIERTTRETRIVGRVELDAAQPITVSTGIGFFDHMLEQIAKHGGFSLELKCAGDLQVDEHHTIEDCALALGDAMRRALGNKRGIARYGFLLPMDEAEAQVSVDLSGRAYAVFDGQFGRESVGGMPTELVSHFFRSFAESLGAALHVRVHGANAHHMIEACFKGVGRALRQAIRRDGVELPTTKGVL